MEYDFLYLSRLSYVPLEDLGCLVHIPRLWSSSGDGVYRWNVRSNRIQVSAELVDEVAPGPCEVSRVEMSTTRVRGFEECGRLFILKRRKYDLS